MAPYLVNGKRLSDDNAYGIIVSWLDECGKLERIAFYYNSRVRGDIRRARRFGYYPIGLSKLQIENPRLYRIVTETADGHMKRLGIQTGTSKAHVVTNEVRK